MPLECTISQGEVGNGSVCSTLLHSAWGQDAQLTQLGVSLGTECSADSAGGQLGYRVLWGSAWVQSAQLGVSLGTECSVDSAWASAWVQSAQLTQLGRQLGYRVLS